MHGHLIRAGRADEPDKRSDERGHERAFAAGAVKEVNRLPVRGVIGGPPLADAADVAGDERERNDDAAEEQARLNDIDGDDRFQPAHRRVDDGEAGEQRAEPGRGGGGQGQDRHEDFVDGGENDYPHPHQSHENEEGGAEQARRRAEPRLEQLIAAGDAKPHEGRDDQPAGDEKHEWVSEQAGEDDRAVANDFAGYREVGDGAEDRDEEGKADGHGTHRAAAHEVVGGVGVAAAIPPADAEGADGVGADHGPVERGELCREGGDRCFSHGV